MPVNRLYELQQDRKLLLVRIQQLEKELDSLRQHLSSIESNIEVTKATMVTLSLDEKVALFRSLFRGREDVFARRWQSRRGSKSGYQPVCVNYGSILRNSIAKAPTASGIISSLYSATGKEWHYGDTDEKINGYGTSCEYSQTLVFDASSNTFRTKLDFATNSETSKVSLNGPQIRQCHSHRGDES